VLLLAAAVAAGGSITIAQTRGGMSATAEIKGDKITGPAELVERAQGTGTMVEITLRASGLTPGKHGVHLHAVGKCEAPFTSAGGHFDPGPASNTDPDANHPYHMGDTHFVFQSRKGIQVAEGRFVSFFQFLVRRLGIFFSRHRLAFSSRTCRF
jgi:Cu/Zn superoxide dismutase